MKMHFFVNENAIFSKGKGIFFLKEKAIFSKGKAVVPTMFFFKPFGLLNRFCQNTVYLWFILPILAKNVFFTQNDKKVVKLTQKWLSFMSITHLAKRLFKLNQNFYFSKGKGIFF